MKLGIKCEIHDCTIALLDYLEGDLGLPGVAQVLTKDKDLRIDNQYYLKNRPVTIDLDKLAQFLLSIKSCLVKLDDGKIEQLRKKVFSS